MSGRQTGFVESLRRRLVAEMKVCPTCGRAEWKTLRTLAKELRTSPASLTRWLNQGKSPAAKLIDAAVAHLGR